MKRWCYNKKIILFLLAGACLVFSCNKQDFLGKKPSSDLVVPSTLEDFQALLDNDKVMAETPELGELSADNFYLPDSYWQGLDTKERNAYIWAPDIYGGQGIVDDWDYPYEQVYYANLVLEGLPGIAIDSGNIQQWKTLQGAAYFIRAYAFYNLAQLFANVYSPLTINDPGIPLRLVSDVRAVSVRATIGDTYAQILRDLRLAENLLPAMPSQANLNRPSKPAALAMLARVYLSMRDYPDAGHYADSCLQLYNTLMDYATLPPGPSPFLHFSASNAETLYQSHLLSTSNVFLGLTYPAFVDSNLYRSYAAGDLRKTFFYTAFGSPEIQGSYNGSLYPFSGLAIDEVYLIRAECSARNGNADSALNDLNTLLVRRWKSGSFVPYTPATPSVLDTVLAERRKELAFRGLRWTDLRRLNAEGKNITLTRWINDSTYQLLPNSNLYIMPIPPDVIAQSGITQNQR